MKLLSLKELDMFDYVKTKEKVEEYIGDLNMIKYKYRNVLPPPIASRLFDIKVQSSPTSRSCIESYVEKRDEYNREYKQKLNEIYEIIEEFSYYEKRFFKDYFINGVKLRNFEKEFACGERMVDHIKESSIIKFALATDLAVYK